MACGCTGGNCQTKYKIVVPLPVTRATGVRGETDADRVRKDAIRKALNQK